MILVLAAFEPGPAFVAQASLELSIFMNTDITSLGQHTQKDKGIKVSLDEPAVGVENYGSWGVPGAIIARVSSKAAFAWSWNCFTQPGGSMLA